MKRFLKSYAESSLPLAVAVLLVAVGSLSLITDSGDMMTIMIMLQLIHLGLYAIGVRYILAG